MQQNWRDKYSNPFPPSGYAKQNPRIELKIYCRLIDGITCEFLGLIIDSGVLEDNDHTGDFNPQTSDEEEIVEVPVKKKVAPVIDLEEDQSSNVHKVQSEAASVNKYSSFSKEKKLSKAEKDKKSVSHKSGETTDSQYHSKKKRVPDYKHSKSLGPSDIEDSDYYDKKRLKNDPHYPLKIEPNLGRFFYCKICKASMNNEMAYQSHMNGKRHLKTIKQQNIALAVEESVNPATVLSRYPLPAPNVCRVKTREIAESQRVIEENVKSPCPGLEKVIEIQGLDETRYYCELCEAPCNSGSIVPHLKGYPHQWQCLKYFEPEFYESVSHLEKHKVKGKVIKILKDVELKRGRGKLAVEKEFINKKEYIDFSSQRDPSWGRTEEILGPSHIPSSSLCNVTGKVFADSYAKTIIPDMSKPDFYCQMCDAHMNNQQMWESHIRGKRHITNCKKAPGEAPSKKKTVLVPNARAALMNELDHISEPVVGLAHIRETQKPEVSGAMYNCFLCGACCGAEVDIIDHILTQKHRTKYLEKINHPDMKLLLEMNMQEHRLLSIVEEICAQVEAERGRGEIEVHVTKNAITW